MKTYISPRIEEIKIINNVIATSNYGLNDGKDGDGAANNGGNSLAPSRYGRTFRGYDAEYDLY